MEALIKEKFCVLPNSARHCLCLECFPLHDTKRLTQSFLQLPRVKLLCVGVSKGFCLSKAMFKPEFVIILFSDLFKRAQKGTD